MHAVGRDPFRGSKRALRGVHVYAVSPGKDHAPSNAAPTLALIRGALASMVHGREFMAAEMRQERLPKEFIETIETGWWTTCLEILPARERALSRY